MKVFKYEESKLVKLKEANKKSNEVKNTEVESFLNERNFILPNKLNRGDIYWALTPYRYNGGKTCKPHPVMVIEDFGLNYDTFAKKVEKKILKQHLKIRKMPIIKKVSQSLKQRKSMSISQKNLMFFSQKFLLFMTPSVEVKNLWCWYMSLLLLL